MKKIILSILCTVIASAIVGVNSMLNSTPKEKPQEQLNVATGRLVSVHKLIRKSVMNLSLK